MATYLQALEAKVPVRPKPEENLYKQSRCKNNEQELHSVRYRNQHALQVCCVQGHEITERADTVQGDLTPWLQKMPAISRDLSEFSAKWNV